MTTTEVCRIEVDLDDPGVVGVELTPGEVGTKHQQGVAIEDRAIPGLAADQPGHADVEGVVVFHRVLGARGMRDRRSEALRYRYDLVMGLATSGAGIDRDLTAAGEDGRDRIELFLAWHRSGIAHMDAVSDVFVHMGSCDVDRDDQHRNALLRDRRLTRDDGFASRLLGRVDHVAVDAAPAIDVLEVDFLDVIESEFVARNLTCDEDHGRAVAMSLEDAIHEMEAARAATARDGGQSACQLRLGTCGERTGLLMSDMDPADAALLDAMSDVVQRIADDPVAAFNAGGLQCFDDGICDAGGHSRLADVLS